MGQFKILQLVVIILLIFNIFAVPIRAGVVEECDSLIRVGIDLSIQHQYDDAEKVFQGIIKNYPEHPIGYFFMAATIQSKMMDFESHVGEEDFKRYIQLTIYFSKSLIKDSTEVDPWLLFTQGSALCYLAFFEGRNGEYVAAIRHGFSGISILNEIVEKYPGFDDVYFGIGSYKYWRSQTTRHLNWLPLLSDDRKEGIEMVRQAVTNGKYTRYAAMNELIWILMDADMLEEAYQWALKGLEKFPESRFFLWGAAKSAVAMDNDSLAVKYFNDLLESILQAKLDNFYNEYLCRLNLAKCYMKQERYAEAALHVDILKSVELDDQLNDKLKKQKKTVAELDKKLATLVFAKNSDAILTPENNSADK